MEEVPTARFDASAFADFGPFICWQRGWTSVTEHCNVILTTPHLKFSARLAHQRSAWEGHFGRGNACCTFATNAIRFSESSIVKAVDWRSSTDSVLLSTSKPVLCLTKCHFRHVLFLSGSTVGAFLASPLLGSAPWIGHWLPW